jgi:hypothetical protein
MTENDPAPAMTAASLKPIPASLTTSSNGPAQYEFSIEENATIWKLGSKMSFVGLFMLGIGLFFFLSGLVRWVQTRNLEVSILFLALLFVVVGIWTHRAGREFLSVAETQGNDVSHLMRALSNLLKFYTLLYLLFFVALVFAIIQLGAHSVYGTRQSAVGVIQNIQSQGSSDTIWPLSSS